VPVDPTMGGKVADPIKPSCLGCAYDGPTHCESPTICNKSGHFKPTGYVSSKELKKWRV